MASAPASSEGLINLQFVTVETFVIQFVILLIVLWVLNKYLFKPYLAYLDEWEAKQSKVKEDYDNAESLLQEKQKQGDVMLEDARRKGNALIEEAEIMANSKKDKILEQAESQAKETLELSRKNIENERQSMLSDIKGNVVDMALKLNEKLFKEEKTTKDFLSKNIDHIK